MLPRSLLPSEFLLPRIFDARKVAELAEGGLALTFTCAVASCFWTRSDPRRGGAFRRRQFGAAAFGEACLALSRYTSSQAVQLAGPARAAGLSSVAGDVGCCAAAGGSPSGAASAGPAGAGAGAAALAAASAGPGAGPGAAAFAPL